MKIEFDRGRLERIYEKYNRRYLVHPDPLEFLYDYPRLEDREIVALIASSLAYGRVAQILKSVKSVLDEMRPNPLDFIKENSKEDFQRIFKGFKHRFTTGEDIACLMAGVQGALESFGSLENCFKHFYREHHEDVVPSICGFVDFLRSDFEKGQTYLLPHPEKGSACKRLMLFLRWMIRRDEVDPGGWSDVPASLLIVPLDTHMHKISLKFALTKRKQADLKTAIEITDAFRRIAPDDPVKYDFSLTRFGIRDDMGDIERA